MKNPQKKTLIPSLTVYLFVVLLFFFFLEYCIFFPSDYRLNSYPLVHSVNRHGLILGNTNANGIFYCLIYISLMTNDTEYLFM